MLKAVRSTDLWLRSFGNLNSYMDGSVINWDTCTKCSANLGSRVNSLYAILLATDRGVLITDRTVCPKVKGYLKLADDVYACLDAKPT